ncbi:MAG: TonB-dependent receptor [Gammaproteobacteria bacterium]|nr:TonB-dependent receptor [Gammaproteobacteria bacterium]
MSLAPKRPAGFALSLLSLALSAQLNTAQAADAAPASGSEEEVETMQVIGSRVQIRSAADSAVPVDIMRGEDLERSGLSDVGTALESLAPSFNFAETTISDGSDHVKPATLRGLNPDQTLVLINGKRRHNSALIHIFTVGKGSAGTDLNAIPMSAVERLEILRDGASAQYGSDAIAGVINIVLKKNLGTTITQDLGKTDHGDGDTYQTSLNTGFALGSDGVFNITAEYKHKNDTNRAATDPTGGRWRTGEPKLEQQSLFFNSEVPMGTAEFYAFGGYSSRDAEAAGFFRYPYGHERASGSFPEALGALYPNGFLPLINSKVIDKSLAGGLRFDWGGWAGDVSVTHGQNNFEFGVSNSVNFSYGAGPTGNVAEVPTSAKAGELEFKQTTFNFDLSNTVKLGSKDVAVAFGAEHRKDDYAIHAGDEYSYAYYGDQPWGNPGASPGIQVFPGWSPAQANSADRDNTAFFLEASTDITYDWRIEAALRHEDYSDFGTDLSAKLATYLNVTDNFKLRASVSDGFRAPSLQQYAFSQEFSDFSQGQNIVRGIYPHGSAVVNALGIPALDAEKSLSYTFGLVLQPLDDLDVTVDFYRIDIDDRIALSGTFTRDMHPVLDQVLPLGVGSAAFFTNAINTRTDGVDIVANYRQELGNGAEMKYSAAFSHNTTDVQSVNTPPGRLAELGLEDVYFDAKERIRVEDYQPNNRATLGGIYDAGGWELGLTFNYYDDIVTANDAADRSYDFSEGSAWITDLAGKYDFGNGLVLSGGINNLTDKFPDGDPTEYNYEALKWSIENSQWGLAGRYFYTRASYSF